MPPCCFPQEKLSLLSETPDPPGTIDGAKNPELIPDSVARRLFFSVVSEPTGASKEQLARQRDKLRAANLSDEEVSSVSTCSATFHDKFFSLSPQSASSPTELFNLREQLVEDAHKAIQQALSQAALDKLELHIKARKAHMKLFPDPQM